MKIGIHQVRGGSGVDVWAKNLCKGIQFLGHECRLELQSPLFQFIPALAYLLPVVTGYDIIHSNTWNGFVFREKCPLVVTEHHVIHDPAYSPYKTIPQKIYHRWIYHCEQTSLKVADAVTCDCEYTQRKLKEVFGYSDAHLVYVGIDENLFRPNIINRNEQEIPTEKTVLFFAGNLSIRKGADLLPAIMKQLGEDYLLLVASGQKQGSIMGCKNIINLGRLTLQQLVDTYNLCDIFLSSSRLEGFGLSIAEAMACGKPVVATNCTSIPELVVDERGGSLCQMNDVKDFAEKIQFIASDEDLRRAMGLFNRRRVEDMFTIERMTKGYLDIYRSLVQ